MKPRKLLLSAAALAVTGALTLGLPATSSAAQSASGPPGYRLVFGRETPVADGMQARSTVHCPKGTVPIGGGVFVDEVSLTVSINSSFPIANGWVGVVNNSSGASNAFLVVVTCASKPAHYSIVSSKAVRNASPQRTAVSVSCPKTAKPLAGGSQSNGFTSVALGASRPFHNGWRITEENGTATLAARVTEPDPTVKAFAVCGSVPGYRLVMGTPQPVPPLSRTPLTSTCPTGSVVLGGGASVNATSLGVHLGLSGPVNETPLMTGSPSRVISSWSNVVANNNEVDATGSPFAICAGR